MEILRLQINNFLTIGQASLTLNNKGLVAIQGENEDDSSASSNGVGKSSIPDALCWALYGTTARGESGDSIVNRTAKRDCWVEVTLKDGATFYEVRRYRKNAVMKNALTVRAASNVAPAEVLPSDVVELHKGTEKETQEVINNIMGCSLEVFAAAVYAGQEQMPDLPRMTDKQLKMMIEEAAGIDRLEAAYLIARDKALTAQGAHDRLGTQLANQRMQRANTELAVNGAIDDQSQFEANRAVVRDAKLDEAARIKKDMLNVAVQVKSMDEPELTRQRGVYDNQLASYRTELQKLQALEKALSDQQIMAARAETHAASHAKDVARIDHNLAHLTRKVGTPCLECGKPYAEKDLDGAHRALEKQLEAARVEHEASRALVVTEKSTVDELRQKVDAFKLTLPDVSHVNAELRIIAGRLNEITRLKQMLQTLNVQKLAAEIAAEQAMIVPNPHDAAVKRHAVQLEDCNKQITSTEVALQQAQKALTLAQAAVKVFGPAGVRAHVLDTVTPFLNDKTSEYLGALSDGNISAVWSTLSKTAKGELREKFNIDVTHAKGGDSFGLLSGGEKRKVRLATMLALQDLVAARAIKPINIWIGDEIDDALDQAGLERLMDLLDRKAKERGTVLVISHNDLSDWCDQVATVVKRSGYSTVAGALS